MGLLKLPPELLIAIMQWLPSVAQLVAVHSALREAAEARLYSDVCFTWSQDGATSRIKLFLRTLSVRPELGQHLRTLDLQCDRRRPSENIGEHPEALQPDGTGLDSEQDEWLAAIRSLGFTEKKPASGWANKICLGDSDAVLALIVALSPNIRRLSLSSEWTVDLTLLGLVFKTALCRRLRAEGTCRLPIYQDLTFVSLAPWFPENRVLDAPETDDILALFYLPNVEELDISIASRAKMGWPYEHPPKPTSLRSLVIHRLREQFLGPVLSVCSSLESLHYKWLLHNGVDQPHPEAPLDLTEMASNIVSHCGRTLKTLRIDAATQLSPGYYDDPPLEMSGSLDSLKGLTSLEKLALPWPFVCGSTDSPLNHGIRNITPECLRYLQLNRQLVRYEEFGWTPAEVLDLVAIEVDAGFLRGVPGLEGIRTSLALTMSGVVVDDEVLQEMDRLRASDLQVDVDEPDCSVYITTRPDSHVRHHI